MELTGMVDTSVSDRRGGPVTEQQLLRMAKRRLAILRHAEEITGNVSLTFATVWGRGVLHGGVNHPRIDGKDGVAGSRR